MYALCDLWVRVLECYFLGTSGDETETHLQPIYNKNNKSSLNSSPDNNTTYAGVHFVMRKKVFRWNCWILRDITHLRSGHYTSLTQYKTYTRTHTNKNRTVWFIEWKENWSIFIFALSLYQNSIAKEAKLVIAVGFFISMHTTQNYRSSAIDQSNIFNCWNVLWYLFFFAFVHFDIAVAGKVVRKFTTCPFQNCSIER